MGLNATPSGERVHIGFFGVRNAGKSSLVNAVTGQDLAVVSNTPGTTTDPVRKAMELLPLGPVLIVDTPGIDDVGELGGMRVEKAKRALDATDVAVLVVDASVGLSKADRELISAFQERNVPYVIAWSKIDIAQEGFDPDAAFELADSDMDATHAGKQDPAADSAVGESANAANGGIETSPMRGVHVLTSSVEKRGVEKLKEVIASIANDAKARRKLVSDLLEPGDVVVLVVPIDSAAPKGRLILPQQQVIRDCVEAGAFACVTSVEGLSELMESLARPVRLVITDSQVFGQVARIVPAEVPLTSFSILMARYKGTLAAQVRSVSALDELTDGDVVLISEGCTHHRQCGDIGTVKLPQWIRELSGADVRFEFTSGGEFPSDLSAYSAVVHCGGCMLNAREMEHRADVAADEGVAFTNYGMTIAKANGVLDRSLAPVLLLPEERLATGRIALEDSCAEPSLQAGFSAMTGQEGESRSSFG